MLLHYLDTTKITAKIVNNNTQLALIRVQTYLRRNFIEVEPVTLIVISGDSLGIIVNHDRLTA